MIILSCIHVTANGVVSFFSVAELFSVFNPGLLTQLSVHLPPTTQETSSRAITDMCHHGLQELFMGVRMPSGHKQGEQSAESQDESRTLSS